MAARTVSGMKGLFPEVQEDMRKSRCEHIWEMINITSGLIVIKKCFQCGKVSTCFAFHNSPPLEECYEDKHFWNFMEGDESFHFDLKCSKCEALIKLDELVGLMICTGCDEACGVDSLRRKLEPEGTRVCIAFGRRPIDERKQLPPDKFAALVEYFSRQNEASKTNIKIVSHEMVRDIARCYAEPIKKVNMLFSAALKS